jgi:hypothetical protein
MLRLDKYLWKTVKVYDNLGRTIIGEVVSFSTALQNVEDFELEAKDSIDIQQDGYAEFIYTDDIVEIEILDEAQLLFNSLLPGGSTLLYAKWPNAEKWSDADVLAWFEGSTNLVLEGGIKVPIKKVFPRCYPNEISALIESDMTEFPKHLCPVYAVAE